MPLIRRLSLQITLTMDRQHGRILPEMYPSLTVHFLLKQADNVCLEVQHYYINIEEEC